MSNLFPSNDEACHVVATLVPNQISEDTHNFEIQKLCLQILSNQLGSDNFGSLVQSKSYLLKDALPIFYPGHF